MMNQFNFMLQIPNKIIPIIIWMLQTMVSFQKSIQTESASNSGIIFSNNTVHIGKHVNSTWIHWPLKFHCWCWCCYWVQYFAARQSKCAWRKTENRYQFIIKTEVAVHSQIIQIAKAYQLIEEVEDRTCLRAFRSIKDGFISFFFVLNNYYSFLLDRSYCYLLKL